MTSALNVMFRHAGLPRQGRPCLLVAHLAVAGSKASPIGSLEAADYHVFEPFAYTALGHFHMPHNVGGARVRYCGSPLCFSQKEAQSPQKYIDVIDITADGDVEVISHPIQPLFGVAGLEDCFEALLSDKYPSTKDYVFITIKGDNAESDAARRLIAKFSNCVNIRYSRAQTEATEAQEYTKLDFGELFSGFYKLAMGEDIRTELLDTAREIFNGSKEGAGS